MAREGGVRSKQIAIYITPELHQVLQRLADAQDKSLSASTADILEEAAPNLVRLAKLAEVLRGKRKAAFGVLPKGAT